MTLFTVPSRYSRKPFDVDAVRVTEENFEDVAEWCGGEIRTNETSGQRTIIVPVKKPRHANQRIARIGSWVVFSIVPIGFKVYSDNAFRNTFEPFGGTPVDQRILDFFVSDTAEEAPETDAK